MSAAKSSRRGRTGPMAAGLLLAILVIFMAPLSVRETCTHINRGDYRRDELELESFRAGSGKGSRTRLEGHIVSTGEAYRTDRTEVVGLDRLRDLSREGKVPGHRVPVWYLPKDGFWSTIDKVTEFRVRSVDEFEMGFPAGLVAFNVVAALGSVVLIRRGAGLPKPSAREETPRRKGRP